MNLDRLSTLLDRHSAFWDLSPVGEPLIAKVPAPEWGAKPYPLSNDREAYDFERLHPGDVCLEKLIGGPADKTELLIGDFFASIGPAYPQAWMESLIGCPVSVSEYSCVARPAGPGVVEAIRYITIDYILESHWANVMDSALRHAAGLSGGELPVRQLHLRGVIDMLAAYLGEEALCLALYDEPVALRSLRDAFAELYLKVARRGLALRSPWNGGYVSNWNLFAPGRLLDYQIDASSLFSPAVYGEFFLEVDREILADFEYSIVHLHACGLYLLDLVLDIPELNAVEISIDRETGDFNKEFLLSSCKKIQSAGKGVLLSGELTEEELREFVAGLGPNGLAIYYWNPEIRARA